MGGIRRLYIAQEGIWTIDVRRYRESTQMWNRKETWGIEWKRPANIKGASGRDNRKIGEKMILEAAINESFPAVIQDTS